MVPKSKAGHVAYVSDFLEEAKAIGLVKHTIDQANLHGLQVAPSGKANSARNVRFGSEADMCSALANVAARRGGRRAPPLRQLTAAYGVRRIEPCDLSSGVKADDLTNDDRDACRMCRKVLGSLSWVVLVSH